MEARATQEKAMDSKAKTKENVKVKLFGTTDGSAIERIYTVQEAARMLRVTPGWIYQLISTGKLRSIYVTARRRQITQGALEEYRANHPTPARLAVVKQQKAQRRAERGAESSTLRSVRRAGRLESGSTDR